MSHRNNVRNDIIDYLDAHPNCTFQEMVDAWVHEGTTLHSGILWDFVVEQGLDTCFVKV